MAIDRTVGIGLEFTQKDTELSDIIKKLSTIETMTSKKQYKISLSGAKDLLTMANNSDKFDKLALALKNIESLDLSKLSGSLGSGAFKKSISEINKLFKDGMNIKAPSSFIKTINELQKTSANLKSMDYSNVKKNIDSLTSSLSGAKFNNLTIGQDVQSSMTKISTLLNSLKKLEGINSGKIDSNLKGISLSIRQLTRDLMLMEKDGIKSLNLMVLSLRKLEKLDIAKLSNNLNAFAKVSNSINIDNKELSDFVSNLKNVGNVKSLKTLAKEANNTSKSIKSTGGSFLGLVTAVTATRKAIQLIRGDYAELEKSVYDLGIVSDMSIGQIREMKNELIDIASTTKISAREMADAINMVQRTGKYARVKPFFMLGVPKVA